MYKFFSFFTLLFCAESSVVQAFPYTDTFTTHSPPLTLFMAEMVADAFVSHEEVKANKHASAEAKKSLIERVATAQNIGRMGAANKAERDAHAHNKKIDQWSAMLPDWYKEAKGIHDDDRPYQDPKKQAQKAYLKRETEIAHDAGQKLKSFKSLSSYELSVANDYARHTVTEDQKSMAYVAGGAMLTASATASMTGIGVAPAAGLGSAGTFLLEVANRDFELKTKQDLIETAASTILGGASVSTKIFFPTALTTLGLGGALGSGHMMVEGFAGAALSVVPFVREMRAANNINMTNAHVISALDDLMVRVPANGNNPLTRAINHNRMPLPHVVETTEMGGMQQLAKQISGGSRPIVSKPINYRELYMSSKSSGVSGVGVNSGTLTMDGGTRTLNGTKTGSGKLVLGNQGTGTFHRAPDLKETTARTVASWEGAKASKLSTPGGVIRADAIPNGSQLEYLAPGRVKFDGVEFRAVRDLGHMSDSDLVRMSKTGVAPRDIKGLPIEGHHHLQQYHRDTGAFVVEIPEPNHCISNSIQHPLGTTGGLSEVERADWTRLRRAYYKERAKTELLKRNSLNG